MNDGFVIAIDGPVASGKGTVAPLLAKKLNGSHLYTGAMYRAVALFCLEHNIPLDNETEVINTLENIKISLEEEKVFLNGKDVAEKIQQPEVANGSAQVSIFRKVRESMVTLQREIAEREIKKGKTVIAEGRDTATVVFPDAKIKIFLTADPKIRAQRRIEQYEIKGVSVNPQEVLADTIERDEMDTQREIDPLVKNPEEHGYIIVDDSSQTLDQTVETILSKL